MVQDLRELSTLLLQKALPSCPHGLMLRMPEIEHSSKLPPEYKSLDPIVSPSSGTIVSWKECDRLDHVRASTTIEHAQTLLGRIFRDLIKGGKSITLEVYEHQSGQNLYSRVAKQTVGCNDPLFLTEECQLAKELCDGALFSARQLALPEAVSAQLKDFATLILTRGA